MSLIGMSFSWAPETGWYVPVAGPKDAATLPREQLVILLHAAGIMMTAQNVHEPEDVRVAMRARAGGDPAIVETAWGELFLEKHQTAEALKEFFNELNAILKPVPADELARVKQVAARGVVTAQEVVAVARNVGRKRAMEMALSGDVIDAHTADGRDQHRGADLQRGAVGIGRGRAGAGHS